jgi:hypothetical protein
LRLNEAVEEPKRSNDIFDTFIWSDPSDMEKMESRLTRDERRDLRISWNRPLGTIDR